MKPKNKKTPMEKPAKRRQQCAADRQRRIEDRRDGMRWAGLLADLDRTPNTHWPSDLLPTKDKRALVKAVKVIDAIAHRALTRWIKIQGC
jgi:hypothetical protein